QQYMLPAAVRRCRSRRCSLPLHHHQGQGPQHQPHAAHRHRGARQPVRQESAERLPLP
ncbi:hypothetical protein CFC21_106521, partial [Triticum aestivum]